MCPEGCWFGASDGCGLVSSQPRTHRVWRICLRFPCQRSFCFSVVASDSPEQQLKFKTGCANYSGESSWPQRQAKLLQSLEKGSYPAELPNQTSMAKYPFVINFSASFRINRLSNRSHSVNKKLLAVTSATFNHLSTSETILKSLWSTSYHHMWIKKKKGPWLQMQSCHPPTTGGSWGSHLTYTSWSVF